MNGYADIGRFAMVDDDSFEGGAGWRWWTRTVLGGASCVCAVAAGALAITGVGAPVAGGLMIGAAVTGFASTFF